MRFSLLSIIVSVLLVRLSTGLGLTVLMPLLWSLQPLLLKRCAPGGLYAAWVALLVGLMIPFSLFATQPAWQAQVPQVLSQPVASTWRAQSALAPVAAPATGSAAVSASAALQPQAAQTAANASVQPQGAPIDWMSLLCYVWLAGAVVTLLLPVIAHVRFLRTVRRWRCVPQTEGYAQALAEAREALGVRRQVGLYVCPAVSSPMLVGLTHPAILLPDEALTLDELPLVLRHELTHLKCGDLAVKWLLVLARALHWYNPAVWLMSRGLCFCQEAACDSRVLGDADDETRRFYSETILRVIRRQVQSRSVLCTSFYGGKNGMRRRIQAILTGGGRRAGMALAAAAVMLTAALGCAVALEPPDGDALPRSMWVHAPDATGAMLLSAPSVNDLSCPMGIYLNGTPVTVVEPTKSSALPEWEAAEDEPNWARVLIGGDGVRSGMYGWMPLRDLSDAAEDALPTATLASPADTGHTDVYTLNTRESAVLRLERNGASVQVLGQLGDWLHIALEGEGGFVLLADAALSDEADQRLYDLLPDRFENTSRVLYDEAHSKSRLIDEKIAAYNGWEVEYWSPEDQAWYAQLMNGVYLDEVTTLVPGADDLPEAQAREIALSAYA